jgi:diaminohydroxyphosphoribosylaminopyrimidine deaminase/5-amino-6-(5-phosphoribosylamino)uracil reductase
VIGAGDPNPANAGRAAAILEAGGIEVTEGIEESACEELIRAFSKVQISGLPWVIVKTAMSLDGRITRPPGEGQWLSSEASRADVHRLRGEADAILTSGRTVRADNPRLTVRSLDVPEFKEQPLRVILTSSEIGVPATAHVLADEFKERTLVFAGQRLECVLRELVTEHDVTTVLVEAGGELAGRLLDEGWADEVVVYLAPLFTGGGPPAVGGEGASSRPRRHRLDSPAFERTGSDVRLRALVAGPGPAREQ